MSTLRQIRRPLLPGETVPPIPSLYEQIASVKGGTAPVIPQPTAPESVIEDEDEELTRLRRENRQLKMERDILAKATAWFARKSDVSLPGSSNS